MDDVVIVDCGKGEVLRREMTPGENAQRQKDVALHEQQQQERQQADADREGVLAQVAQKMGVDVAAFKHAIGVGNVPSGPDRKKRTPAR